MTIDEVLAGLDKSATELFGPDPAQAARRYRRMVRLVHPDATGGRTRDAFIRLNRLWRSYGQEPLFTTPRATYRLAPRTARGDLADLFPATMRSADGGGGGVVVKVVRDPGDGDLIEREAVALAQLPKDGDRRFLPYAPRLVESFHQRDPVSGVRRRVNVIQGLAGFHSLAEVRAAYPQGVDGRDAAWMWRRLLVGLGFAHRAGVLHGAVLPEHVLIHPADHGLVLVDWCYSVPGCYAPIDASGRVPAMVDRYADWYPPEVPGRRPASAATDIYLAARCMAWLMGDQAPAALLRFAHGCLLTGQDRRPSDAWRLLGELDELLERLYGPRRFRPFSMAS